MTQLQGATVYSSKQDTEMVYQLIKDNIGIRVVKIKQGGYITGYRQFSNDGGASWLTSPVHKLTDIDCRFCHDVREDTRKD